MQKEAQIRQEAKGKVAFWLLLAWCSSRYFSGCGALALADKTTHKLALGGLLHAQERNAHRRKAPRVDFAVRHLPVDPAC